MNKYLLGLVLSFLLCACGSYFRISKSDSSFYYSRKTEKMWHNYPTPQQYGAVGDGVHDDRESIQKILNKGGDIYFPKGVYLISNAIFVKSPNTFLHLHPQAIIECHNRTHSIADYGNAGGTIIFSPYYDAINDDVPLLKHVGIEGGIVRNTSIGENENAIGFAMCDSFFCKNVVIPYCNRKGISLQIRNSHGVIQNNEIRDCGLDGITIEDRCTNILVSNNFVSNATRRGVYITGCSDIIIEDNHVTSVEDAVYCVKSNVDVYNNTVNSSLGRGIVIINKPEHFQSKVMTVNNNNCNSTLSGIFLGDASDQVIIVKNNTLNNTLTSIKVELEQDSNTVNIPNK